MSHKSSSARFRCPVVLVAALVAWSPVPVRAASTIAQTEDRKGTGYPDSRKMARDSRGSLYAAYRRKDASGIYQVYVARSEDNGASWEDPASPVASIATDHQRVPSIAVGRNDVIHVVWYGRGPTNPGANERQIKYTKSADHGATWSPWKSVGGEVPGYAGQDLWQEHPTIYVDGADTLYVVWQGHDSSYGQASQCKFSKSADGGGTWSAWRNISPSSTNRSRPTLLARSDTSKLYVLAYGGVSGVQQIVWSSSADGGRTWSAWSTVHASPNDQRHVSVAIDQGDRLHAVWRELGRSGTTQIQYSRHDGSSWSSPVMVGANRSAYQFFPSIAVTSFGKVWAVWAETNARSGYPSDDPTSARVSGASTDKNGAWKRASIAAGEAASNYPSLRFGRNNNGGNVDVVWLNEVGGVYQIVTTSLGGY